MRGAPKNVIDDPSSGLMVVTEIKTVSGSVVTETKTALGSVVTKTETIPDSVKVGTKTLETREQIVEYYVKAGADQEAYRNRVIDHYMGQIDKHYEHYSRRLFSEGIETALGFDAAIIGLSSTAALFESVAGDLATVISAFAGVRSSIDENLYFDRTLPALIVTMDAERTKVETEILQRKALSPSEYSIEAAIRDVRRYQQAGTLMRAITKVTEVASEEKVRVDDEATVQLQRSFGCKVSDPLSDAASPIQSANLKNRNILASNDSSAEEIRDAKKRVGAMVAIMNTMLERKIDYRLPAIDQAEIIPDRLDDPTENFCDVSKLDDLRKLLKPYLGE